MADPYIPVVVLGDTKGLDKTFLAQVRRAAAAVGATSVEIISGKRSDASHPGGPTNTGVANSNHLTGNAIDGYAYINGEKIPLGTALKGIVGQYGLRSGDVPGFYKGAPDPNHVDNGANVGGAAASANPAPFVVAPRVDSTGKPADVPKPLWDAIKVAAKKHGVTAQVLAGIWRAESGSTFPNPYVNSSGYGGLFGTKNWSASTAEQADTAASILRAQIRATGNLHDALLSYSGGGYYTVPGVNVPRTTAQQVADATRAANTQAGSPAYIDATTGLSVAKSTAVAQAKAVAHFNDPWITVTTRNGRVTGFGSPSTGENPPANVLKVQGQPVTQSTFQTLWDASRNNLFESYTGRAATPGEIVGFVSKGLSFYQMRAQLAKTPEFMKSPVWKQEAPGVRATVKAALGTDPPAAFVARAISENWTPDTLAANIKTLPGYHQGPEYLQNFSAAKAVYGTIYGAPDHEGNAWLKTVATQGWTQQQVADALRSAPEYKHSLEYANNVGDLLDTLGMFVGRRAAFKSTKIPNPPLPTGGLGSTVKVLTPGPSPTVGLQPTFGKA